MAKKSELLELLGRDELLGVLDAHELSVADRRRKDLLIAAIAESKAAQPADFLLELPRDRLKELCRQLGLDDAGRAKADLVERLTGGAAGVANTTKKAGPVYENEEARRAATRKGEAKTARGKDNQSALGFEAQLWAAADLLRNNMDPSEYKHVVLGLIFLKYISDAFEDRAQSLHLMVRDASSEYYVEEPEGRDEEVAALLEDRDEFIRENVFWVPPKARWAHIQAQAKQPTIGKDIDAAMDLIEAENPRLKDALPKIYALPGLDKQGLGKLVDLVSKIGLGSSEHRAKDTLGRVYEYFLGRFAGAEGKGGGEYYTPRSIVEVLVEMIEPFKGRVYDPCCGSGGMFVQSLRFIDAHDGRRNQVSIFGQESNRTTWRLARMNLAIRGIEAELGAKHADSFREDLHPDVRANYILSNPPFNISEWHGELLRDDVRWKYGAPPVGNANFAWVQHYIHHLGSDGVAGFVLANGSMSSMQSGEGEIRRKIVEADLVDCMVAMPGQLFYATQIPVCLWFLTKNKASTGHRNRKGETLFIDARKLGRLEDRVHRVLDEQDVQKIAGTYHEWRNQKGAYEDEAGFCKSASLEEIQGHDFVLTPGRYVGAAEVEDDGEPFEEKMARLTAELGGQMADADRLDVEIRRALEVLGYGL